MPEIIHLSAARMLETAALHGLGREDAVATAARWLVAADRGEATLAPGVREVLERAARITSPPTVATPLWPTSS